MVVHKGRNTANENNLLLREMYEEIKQLRAATRLYTELVERHLLTLDRSGEDERVRRSKLVAR
jgi:hypothetical protein